MEYDFRDGRLHIKRTREEKQPIFQRLNRVEGQVRGLRQMIENDRYCGEEVQQASAIAAAVREVVLLMISQHLESGLEYASENGHSEAAVDEMIGLLRIAMGQQGSSAVGTERFASNFTNSSKFLRCACRDSSSSSMVMYSEESPRASSSAFL